MMWSSSRCPIRRPATGCSDCSRSRRGPCDSHRRSLASLRIDRRAHNVNKTESGCLAMLVAVTGTPGTGKTSACDVLSRRGYAVIDLDDVARKEGLIVGRDESRGTDEVDIDALRERLRIPAKVAFLKAHYSHLMDVNIAIVLRCRPSALGQRLAGRGWSPEKVRENVEAEAI